MKRRARCDEQTCLVCGDVHHFLEMASTGMCGLCAPVEIVASIAAPVPDLRAFDQVPDGAEPTQEMRVENVWLEAVA